MRLTWVEPWVEPSIRAGLDLCYTMAHGYSNAFIERFAADVMTRLEEDRSRKAS
jgi:hypothetical protein